MQKAKRNGALYYKCLGILHRLLNLSHFQNNLNIHNKGFKGYNRKQTKKTKKYESSQKFFSSSDFTIKLIWSHTRSPSQFDFTSKWVWFYNQPKWICFDPQAILILQGIGVNLIVGVSRKRNWNEKKGFLVASRKCHQCSVSEIFKWFESSFFFFQRWQIY